MGRLNPNIDSVSTKIERLYKDLKIEPFSGKFDCKYYPECRKSLNRKLRRDIATGNWPFIGVDYGKAEIEGIRCRILVIGMDQGGVGEAHGTDFETRQEEWYWAFHNRDVNAHTGGTHLIIKCLVDHKDQQCFLRQFAHTNSVKCSPKKKEGERMKSETTPVMKKCCRNHLEQELEIFKPDLIITEGRVPTDMVKDILNLSEADYQSPDKTTGKVCEVYEGQPIVLAGPHPARTLKWRYGTSLPPYYAKAIDRVRAIIKKVENCASR